MSKKLFVVLVAVALVAGYSAAPASAQTISELQAQINALLAQLSGLQGGAPTGSAATCTFTRALTDGSSGAEVTCLQNFLIASGHSIPAGATGYFGSQTEAAVKAWQAANGVSPAAGYFGPISQAKYNMLAGGAPQFTGLPAGCVSATGFSSTTGLPCTPVTLPAGCVSATGFSSTTGLPCTPVTLPAGCQVGDLFSSTTGQSCTGTTPPPSGAVTDGSDGSITIATSALVSTGTAVKKGETRNVLSTRLKATGGAVSVNRVEVKFSERPWLTMNQVQVKDGSGNVLATKALTSQADVTEVTVGSDYRVRFEGVNLRVNPGTDVDLVIAVSVLASSDKITGQTVTISIPAGGIRTTNGIGFSETIGPSEDFTFTLPTTGSTADIYTSISPSSPLAGFQTVAAGTTQTENVTLGIFRMKSQNVGSTLNSLGFSLNNSTSVATTTLFSNVRLESGTMSYGASSLAAGASTFTNMQIPLPLDQWVELKLTANVAGADASGGVSASSTLRAVSISGVDANFNSLGISNAGNVTSANRTFLQSGIGVSNTTATKEAGCPNETTPNRCLATYGFTLANTGNNVVYLSKTPGIALATSTSPTSASSTITLVSASNPTEDPADTSASYAIQSGGSRTFTYTGSIKQTAGTTGPHEMSITAIYFGASATAGTQGQASTNATNSLTSGLGNLKVVVGF